MTLRHQYFGIEILNMTAGQRATLRNGLQGIGRSESDPQPARRNHWRVRADNLAVIFEAVFDDDDLTIAAFTARLASIFGVGASTITHNATTQTFLTLPSPVVTFIHSGQNRLRAVLFGGLSATWAQSRAEAAAYLAANAAAWGDA